MRKRYFEIKEKSFTDRTGIEIFEVSAKNSYQIGNVFEKMTRILIDKA